MKRPLRSLLRAVLFLPLLGQAAEPTPPLRILSFNLRYANSGDQQERSWTQRREQVAPLIREDAADLIGFQEALRPMLDDLAARVPGYQEIGVGREDGKTQGEYAALWIKTDRFTVEDSGTFWLSATPDVPNSMSWGNRITRICTWARLRDKTNRATLHFYNVHLDHESQEARLQGTALVAQHLRQHSPTGPWVLTGDFNADEANPAIALLKASPLRAVDSWRALHPDIPLTESGTFHSFNGGRSEGKIDYILVPPNTRLLDAAILYQNRNGAYPSDHFPIRATLAFPIPAGPPSTAPAKR